MDYFYGKRVYITGGSSGIGLEAACMLASSGAHVAIFARDLKKLEAALDRIEAARVSRDQGFYSLSKRGIPLPLGLFAPCSGRS